MIFLDEDPHKFRKKNPVKNTSSPKIFNTKSNKHFKLLEKNIPKISQGLIQFEPWLVVSTSVGWSFSSTRTK
jgi:hypothetical protein